MAQAERYDWRAWFHTCIGGSPALCANVNDLLRINVLPCALVYIDTQGKGSPNCTRVDPFCYVEQAITLNRSLLAAGMPTLTIFTNARREIQRYLASVDASVRPELRDLTPSLTLPRTTRFYAAHFKLDLLEQIGKSVGAGTLVLLLDTDMVALRQLDQDVLRRCYRSGVGAFDISDQEFFAYGAARVVGDLEIVAGKRLNNPRWFGGECLLVSAGFIQVLMPRARECFERYTLAMHRLNHNGDEAFISAALNLLADNGHQIIDVGAYQLVGRHWSGNTHRDLRWFRHCSLLHLPGRKRMLERQARMASFKPDRIWRQIVSAHLLPALRRRRNACCDESGMRRASAPVCPARSAGQKPGSPCCWSTASRRRSRGSRPC
ncbi:response regulator receiver protein [Paraburkholderia sp. RL17-337-BIB-A]|uniref:response regulator receiver protein n=1 Tax=Paraburkholderia sp. RL17-337-BIB-A TaxID=3031636 RepID=UPI0038BA74C6